MTSAPSLVPTMIPSSTPTSTAPSSLPTITGAVIFVEMTQEVITSLTDDEVADIIAAAEVSFGVYPGNVNADVSYEITGIVSFDLETMSIRDAGVSARNEVKHCAVLLYRQRQYTRALLTDWTTGTGFWMHENKEREGGVHEHKRS